MKNVEDIYPLSPMQEGILFHTRHDPVFAMYFEIITWVMRGEVNIPAFGQAWQRVVDRHQVLRTVFVWEGLDEPLQVVRRRARLPLAYHDWRGISAERQEEMVAEFYAAERPFTRAITTTSTATASTLSPDSSSAASGATAAPSSSRCPISSGAPCKGGPPEVGASRSRAWRERAEGETVF